jgi:hypothetical protein
MINFNSHAPRHDMLLLFAILVISSTSSVPAQVPKPPPSKVDNVREVIYGVEIVDPYRWLEDQDSPETRAWRRQMQRCGSTAKRTLSRRLDKEKWQRLLLQPPTKRHRDSCHLSRAR